MKTRVLFFPIVVLLTTAVAFAGWRQPTAAEQAFHQNTLRTIASALPSCPAGWQKTSQTEVEPLEKVYAGEEKWPYQLTYSIQCVDSAKEGASERKYNEAAAARLLSHQNDPDLAALNKERNRLAQAVGQAAGRNDVAEMQRLMKESDVTDAKLKAITDRWQAEEDRYKASTEAHDVRLAIVVQVNVFMTYDKWKPAAPVAGLPVYRIAGGHVAGQGWSEDRNYVFISNRIPIVTENGLPTSRRLAAGTRPYLSVQLIEIKVEADPERSRQVLESIDWKTLQGMIK